MIVELQKLNDMLGELLHRADTLALGCTPISGLDLLYKAIGPEACMGGSECHDKARAPAAGGHDSAPQIAGEAPAYPFTK